MESQNPPSKIARFADFGIGLTSLSGSWNMETNGSRNNNGGGERSPPIGLGLELGSGYGHRQSKKSCGFTILQLQELHLQSLIYKYIEAGLPVPSHLIIPIWKSVATSFNGVSLHQLYPNFMGSRGVVGLNLEFKNNGLDPEPGRCRRTDGKKWRCSKEAIRDHKYCERHVHRGRQRSRKLVEASSRATSTTTAIDASANTNLSISLPVSNNRSGINGSDVSPKSVLLLGGGIQKNEPSL